MPRFSTSIAELLLRRFHNVEPWMERAECAQGDMEWDPLYAPETDQMIDQVCSKCPVVKECGDHAQDILDKQPDGSDRRLMGVFGGVDHSPERKRRR